MEDLSEVIGELAGDNRAVATDSRALGYFEEKWARWIGRIANPLQSRRPQLVTEIGMVIASLERHRMAEGEPEGTVWATVPSAEPLLLDLSTNQDPPREVISTYINGPLFVGGQAEVRFKASVLQISTTVRDVIDEIEPLLDPMTWTTPELAAVLRTASIRLEGLRTVHLSQARADLEERNEFRNLLRGFYRPLTIGGIRYEGINAAHDPPSMALDLVLGTDDHAYRAYLTGIKRHLLERDRHWLEALGSKGSLFGSLSEYLGVRDISASEAHHTLQNQSREVKRSVSEYARLLRSHASLAGAHMGVIKSVLMKSRPTGTEVTTPRLGTGGRSHQHTKSILDMRVRAARQIEALISPSEVPIESELVQLGETG